MTDATKLWCPPSVSHDIWYGWLAGALLGEDVSLARPLLLCFRGVEPLAPETHPNVARPGYHDTGVLVFAGGEQLFPMSSVPYQTHSTESPDVNGDGVGDVGCIKPGRYLLTDKGVQPYPVLVLTNTDGTDRIPCSRDLKHDGLIDHEGPAIYTATAVLVHTGADGAQLVPPSPHTSSIACQTMNVAWLRLIRAKNAGAVNSVTDYLLVDADVAIAAALNSPYLQVVSASS